MIVASTTWLISILVITAFYNIDFLIFVIVNPYPDKIFHFIENAL
jgi:hypothetical protein